MKCKHFITREEMDTNTCYRGKVGSKVAFFRNEKEYIEFMEEKRKKEELVKKYNKAWGGLIPVYFHRSIYTRLLGAFNEVYEDFPYDYLKYRIAEAAKEVEPYMNRIDFKNGNHYASYFIKAFRGTVENGILEYERKKKKEEVKIYKTDDDLMELANMDRRVEEDADSIDEWI